MNNKEKIEFFRRISEDFALKSPLPLIDSCFELLKKDSYLKVSVFGRFKAGKSSFLNSLSSREILPTGVLPVTGVLTEILYADKECAEVEFLSGDKKNVSVEDVSRYISEEKNPQNFEKVKSVKICLPSLKEYKGLVFVDTPGIESVYEHNSETAYSWLPKSEISVLAISCDSPFSDSDAKILKSLISVSGRVILLLTKADMVSRTDAEKIRSFILRETEKKLNIKENFPEIYLYSLKEDLGLKVKISNLFKSVSSDLMKEKEKVITNKISYLKLYFYSYFSASLKAAEEKEKFKIFIDSKKEEIKTLKKDLKILSEKKQAEIRDICEKKFISAKKSLTEKSFEVLDRSLDSAGNNLMKISESYNRCAYDFLNESMSAFFCEEKDFFSKILNESRYYFFQKIRDFLADMARQSSEILGLDFKIIYPEFEKKNLLYPDIKISQAFDSHLDIIWFLIPVFLFKNKIKSHFRDRMEFEVEKNLIRTAMKLSESINKELENSNSIFISDLEGMFKETEKAFSTSWETADKIKNLLEELKQI
ncbi:MAG: hypothetical protein GX447_02970 [Elusimicrobia bacterium]|nr:hypothetical protein [Elusimicrobiota bacterium]